MTSKVYSVNSKQVLTEYSINSLDRRYINKSSSPVQAKNVTLACIDCINPELAVIALNASMNGTKFDEVILFSDRKPDNIPENIHFILIEKLSLDGYQRFCLQRLWKYITTKHVLTIETDGWLINPSSWNNGFLQYDYIGAPWPSDRWWAKRNRVGNSGFCLRSKQLLYQTAQLTTEEQIKKERWFAVDIFTCDTLYDELASRGIKFAPPNVAAKFSYELQTEFGNKEHTLGYHGKDRYETKFLNNRLLAYNRRKEFNGKIRVIYNFYTSDSTDRQKELDKCLSQLKENKFIDEVIVIGDRPSFQDLIDTGNRHAKDNDITIIMNSDCYLDETAADFSCMNDNDFWCLTRHEIGSRGWELWNVIWSQDVWSWKGKCRLKEMTFLPGTMGCDNKILYDAYAAKYDVSNPSRSIRVCHLHDKPERSALKRINGPYGYMLPHLLFEKGELKIDKNPRMDIKAGFWKPK